jgi:hypothetical protein
VEKGLKWGKKLELSTEELVGKIEGTEPEEEKLLLSKEAEKLLLPGDRRECEEVSLINGAAPPPPAIYLGSEGNGTRFIAHRVTVAYVISYGSHPLRLRPKPRNRDPHRAKQRHILFLLIHSCRQQTKSYRLIKGK